jgi:hypothetical protein
MRTVGDSLFLSRIGSDSLAAVFVASGIATAVIASIWYALTRRLKLAVSIKVSGCVFAGLTFAAWAALPYLHHSLWLLAAIYLLTEIKGCVNSINVISGMNELLGGHSSGQAWARIGLGAPLAGVVVGALIGFETSVIDVRSWLLLSAVLDLIALLPLANSSKIKVPRPAIKAESSFESVIAEATNRLRFYACSRQFRFWIGVLIAAKIVVLTLVTFFWKVSVNEYFSGDEQSLTRYFGFFYACVGLLTLVIQGFVTARLISRRTLYIPILVMPLTLLILSVMLILGTGAFFLLVVVTLAKSLEIWRRSVHDTTLHHLYTNIERKKRRSAIAFNSAVVKPLAEVGASVALLFGTAAWHTSVGLVALGVWLVATAALLRLLMPRKIQTATSPIASPNQSSLEKSNVKQLVASLINH